MRKTVRKREEDCRSSSPWTHSHFRMAQISSSAHATSYEADSRARSRGYSRGQSCNRQVASRSTGPLIERLRWLTRRHTAGERRCEHTDIASRAVLLRETWWQVILLMALLFHAVRL